MTDTAHVSDLELLDLVHERLNRQKAAHGIRHLNEIEFDGEPGLSRLASIHNEYEPVGETARFLWDDLFFISNDLVHLTDWLFLLRPYINNPVKEGGTYHQNWYDARYLSYAAFLAAAVYNFWDRIGDLLYDYFTTGLRGNAVYVGRVLNNFPKEHKDSEHFLQLERLYDDEVKGVLDERNEDAHSSSFAARQFVNVLVERDSLEETTGLKLGLPEFFKRQIDVAYEALGCALSLIEERVERKPR